MKRHRILWIYGLVALLLVSLAGTSAARTWRVERDGSGDYITIQPALDAAAAGDTVMIGPGQYEERNLYYLPGNGGWVEVGAYVQVDNLTVIGAGPDVTKIGPDIFSGSDPSTNGIAYLGPGALKVEGITFQNYSDGISCDNTVLTIVNCAFYNNVVGVGWWSIGEGGGIYSSSFSSHLALGVSLTGSGSGMEIKGCTFDQSSLEVKYVQNLLVEDCEFFNGNVGIQMEGGASVTVQGCSLHDLGVVGVSLFSGSSCTLIECDVTADGDSVNDYSGGPFEIINSILVGGSRSCVYIDLADSVLVRTSDLYVGPSNIAVKCRRPLSPVVQFDFRGNYWGTTDPAQIDAWILDGHDDPNIRAEVLYTPFATGATDLVLALTPADSQVVIPDVGGTFQYDAYLENNTAGVIIADIAIEAVLPDGTVYPVESYPGQTIPAASAYTRTGIVQDVPPGAPAGTYTYRVTASLGDTLLVDSDEFPFEKQGVVAAATQDMGWNLQGWDRYEPRTPPVTPAGFALHAATPNPFNPTTTLSFDLPSEEMVTLRVFDLQGRLIRTLINHEARIAGRSAVQWDGRDDMGRQVASGTYFYRIEAGTHTATGRVTMVK